MRPGWDGGARSSEGVVTADLNMARRAAADLGGRRILVVEDEVIVAFNLECELQDAGAVVVGPAYSLDEALTLIDDAEIAVLDINVNGEQVWPIAEKLRQRSIPFVFASANCSDPETVARYEGVPCFDKPVAIHLLVRTLAALGQERRSAA